MLYGKIFKGTRDNVDKEMKEFISLNVKRIVDGYENRVDENHVIASITYEPLYDEVVV